MSNAKSQASARIEIFRHLFAAIAEEMGSTLRLASFSPNIKERLDFSCAIFDPDGAMLAQAMHIPVHLGAMTMSVQAALAATASASGLLPGDVVIINDPYAGGSHLPDITLVTPIYIDSGAAAPTLIGFAGNRAHHADVGGMSPGSMPSGTSIYQEGLRIPPVKLVKGGKLDEEIVAIFLANVRGADERMGDLRAQIAANALGARRMQELIERYGSSEIAAARTELMDYSERAMRAVIAAIPDGHYEFIDRLDSDGIDADPVPIRVAIEIKGERARVDFTGTSPPVRGAINAVEAVTLACVHYVFACLARGQVPANEGATRPIEVIIPRPSLLAAVHPHAVVAGNVETSQRIVDALLGALAPALPERIPAASSGTMNTVTLGGIDPRTGREWSYVETLGGGMGARPAAHGLSGVHTHMTNTQNTPIEALEFAYPLRVRQYRLRANSGGAGRFHGGDGLIREIEALAHCSGSILTERRRFAPWGLAGGRDGATGNDSILRASGAIESLPAKGQLELHPGDRLRIETPGGGGHGAPLDFPHAAYQNG